MVVSIKGKKYWLWRAVDTNGYVLDALLQTRRNSKAALRLMCKLLKGQGIAPRVMLTDKLRSYAAAKAELMPGVEHRSHKGINNRAENSHLPVRRRERRMMGFKSARQCQRFVSVHGQIANLFLLHRKLSPLRIIESFAPTLSQHGKTSLCRAVHERRPAERSAPGPRLRQRLRRRRWL